MSATEIHNRMNAILAELPAIGKSERNEQQQFMFRGHDQVLNALNPLLAKHGVYATPDVLERVTAQRQTRSGGVMYEVNLHVRYTFYASDGSSISASAWGEGTDSGDKSTNKAMTMAFKNVLNQVFAINTQETQNLDTDRSHPEETVARQVPAGEPGAAKPDNAVPVAASFAQKGEITQLVATLSKLRKTPVDQIKSGLANDGYDLDNLTAAKADELVAKMRRWVESTQKAAA
jgi:hypothetical protein